MQRVLFNSTIFGPIHSRRLGTSLGINLSPNDGKVCTFDCLYCEAGYNAQGQGSTGLPPRQTVAAMLEQTLSDMRDKDAQLDVITFSGNGEPTAHPDFEGIVDDVIRLRNEYFPKVKISVLSNSTLIHRPGVARALRRIDNNILKLDSAIDQTIKVLDRPTQEAFNAHIAIERIAAFGPQCIVQTMMLRGNDDQGHPVDNTTDAEVDALIDAYRRINPKEVMLYSIDRKTPAQNLHKVPLVELERIADRIRQSGIKVQVN